MYRNLNKFRVIRRLFKNLKNGASIGEACTGAGISRYAVWDWRKKSEKFDRRVTFYLESRVEIVEDSLYMQARKGNVVACIFYLKNKGGWEDTQLIKGKFEHKGSISVFHSMKDDELNEIISRARAPSQN